MQHTISPRLATLIETALHARAFSPASGEGIRVFLALGTRPAFPSIDKVHSVAFSSKGLLFL
jgi:hypothetical protein